MMTLRRQIEHMIKYKYVPFSFGKQVCLNCTFTVQIFVIYYGLGQLRWYDPKLYDVSFIFSAV